MAGLLDTWWERPGTGAGLLDMGARLLQAGGPNPYPVGLGQAVGTGLQGYLQSSRQGARDALTNKLLGGQGALQDYQLSQLKDWQAMWGGGAASAQTPGVPSPVAPTAPPADPAAIMSQPGMRPGPTPQAASILQTPTVPQAAAVSPTPTGFSQMGIPQAMLPAIRAMGPQAGPQFLAQLAAKNMERGQFIPETRTVEGKTVEGQVDRFSGKWAPLDPTMTKLSVNPTMNLPPQQSAYETKMGQHYADMFSGLQNSVMTSGSRLGKLDRLDSLLSKTYTGAGGENVQGFTKNLKAAADAMSIPTDAITERVGAGEAAQAIAGEMALQLRNPAGGAGMPGAMSDQDREFLKGMTPGLSTTPEGRKLILETQRRLIQRETDIAKLARDYKKKNKGVFDDGFFDELQQWSDKHPLFGGLAVPATGTAGASAPVPAAPANSLPPPPAGFKVIQ